MLFIRCCSSCHCITPHKAYCTSYSTPTPAIWYQMNHKTLHVTAVQQVLGPPAFTWHDRHSDWPVEAGFSRRTCYQRKPWYRIHKYATDCMTKESHQSEAMKDLRSATFDAKLLWWTNADALPRTTLQLSGQDAWPKSISKIKVTCNPYVQTARKLVCNC